MKTPFPTKGGRFTVDAEGNLVPQGADAPAPATPAADAAPPAAPAADAPVSPTTTPRRRRNRDRDAT